MTLVVGSMPNAWWKPAAVPRSVFGDLVIVAFLISQVLDGAFTYVGVSTFGAAIEVNPLMASLMTTVGHGPALALAKMLAAVLGITLHLRRVHGVVALLTGLYVTVAILPWAALLFF